MAAVTICSDFGAQENKISHCFHFFPFLFAMRLSWEEATGVRVWGSPKGCLYITVFGTWASKGGDEIIKGVKDHFWTPCAAACWFHQPPCLHSHGQQRWQLPFLPGVSVPTVSTLGLPGSLCFLSFLFFFSPRYANFSVRQKFMFSKIYIYYTYYLNIHIEKLF